MIKSELFKKDVERACLVAIAGLDSGTVGVGDDCLWQCAVHHIITSRYAPRSAWSARQVFNEVVSQAPFAGFVFNQKAFMGR